jgi:6-phosphogluconolactonase
VYEVHQTNVAAAVTRDLLDLVQQRSPAEVHIALTGGRTGQQIIAALLPQIAHQSNVHLWFSDERFLPAGDPERNDIAVPSGIGCTIHRIAGPDRAGDVEDAAAQQAAELHQVLTSRFCSDNTLMDVTLLSVGSDGHVASLFPGSLQLFSTAAVTAVHDCPKPPATRVTWTYPTINASREVWLLATGSDKRQAVAALRNGADVEQCPASGAHGRQDTRLYTDL